MTTTQDEAYFWSKIQRQGDGCWAFDGYMNKMGYYGVVRFGERGRREYPHRLAYRLAVGPIPEGYVIDHLCRNPGCVNPEHLEAVTPQTNIRRSPRVMKTHCKRGHPFDKKNTYRDKHGDRHCRKCNQMHLRSQEERRNPENQKRRFVLEERPTGWFLVWDDAWGERPATVPEVRMWQQLQVRAVNV